MATKKVTKKVSSEKQETRPGYNKFGVCLACNGNREDCTHQNLTVVNNETVCTTCGEVVE